MASRGWSARVWWEIFHAYSHKKDAKLEVLMMMVFVLTLNTNEVVAEAGDAMDANMTVKESLEGAAKSFGRSEDSEFVCWYKRTSECRKMQKDHDMKQSKGSRIVDSYSSMGSLAEDVDMVSVNLKALEIGPVLLLERSHEIQSGIGSHSVQLGPVPLPDNLMGAALSKARLETTLDPEHDS